MDSSLIISPLFISIHALREESDEKPCKRYRGRSYFNPRPPRGERRNAIAILLSAIPFQSTPSARRATAAAMSEQWG